MEILYALIPAIIAISITFVIPSFVRGTKKMIAYRRIRRLKTKGQHVTVELSKCKVLNSRSAQNVDAPEYYSGANILYKLFYRNNSDSTVRVLNSSMVEYQMTIGSKTYSFYSDPLPVGVETLLFKFEKSLIASLYISKTNIEDYYFDLEFLR